MIISRDLVIISRDLVIISRDLVTICLDSNICNYYDIQLIIMQIIYSVRVTFINQSPQIVERFDIYK